MRQGFGRATAVLVLACAGVTLSVHACKEPTQVTVDIRTLGFRCSELKTITVVVAGSPESAEGKWQFPQAEVQDCKGDFEVGTLVITPSGGRGAVMVLASYTEQRCQAPRYEGCIVARRQFSFIDNVPLHVPITLEASCKDVPCNALSSCRSGSCVSSEVECNTEGTCSTPAEPVVAPDGAVVPPPADATVDAGPPNDVFVPPDDVIQPPVDTGSDTPIDTGSDGGGGIPGGPTNDCQLTSGPVDCELTNQNCCAYMFYFCGSRPTTSATGADADAGDSGTMMVTPGCDGYSTAPAYPCTGRKHCAPNDFCCATSGSPGSIFSACTTGSCSTYLCNTDGDCPSPMKCNAVHQFGSDAGGPIRKCGP